MAERSYKALLVGNAKYPRDPEALPDLKGPANDLRLLRNALTDRRTGLYEPANVKALLNRPRAAILGAIEDFFTQAGRNDQLLLYYSGHGRLTLLDELFLCARDTQTERLRASAVAAHDVKRSLDASAARAKVIVLDCCYSGGFKGGGDVPTRLLGEGCFVLTSSRSQELSMDAETSGGASLFTHYFAEALKLGTLDSDRDGFVSTDDVYRYVREQLRTSVHPTPQREFDRTVDDVALARAWPPPGEVPQAVGSGTSGLGASRPQLGPREAYELGVTLDERGDLEEALTAYQHAVNSGHAEWAPRAANRLGEVRELQEDFKAAQAAYQRAMDSAHPDEAPKGAYKLGNLLKEEGDLEGARVAYQAAMNSGHEDWGPRATLAVGSLDHRLGLLQSLFGDLAGDEMAHPAAATARDGQAALDHARTAYQTAVASGHPEVAPRAAYNLGNLLFDQGEYPNATQEYQRAIDSGHPDVAPAALDSLKRLERRLGQRQTR